MAPVGNLDRISDLPDDLLHLILAGVGEAVTVTSTALLSRRWRRVWIHAQRLFFLDKNVTLGYEPGRFEDFVDWVFAQRGDANIGSLKITYAYQYPTRARSTHERVNQWLRYAMHRVVESLNIYLPYDDTMDNIDEFWDEKLKDEPPIEMPGYGRTSSIEIDLCCRRLRLPMAATAKYEALTELTLLFAIFDDEAELGGARSLGDFVSSCCPRLRKLKIEFSDGLLHLVLRTEALEVLNLSFAGDLRTLHVTAPKLRVLNLDHCFQVRAVGNEARVSAERLDKIAVAGEGLWGVWGAILDIHGSRSVRCLEPIDLLMHGQHYCRDRGSALYLLEKCPGVEHVKLLLQHWEASEVTEDDAVDLVATSEGAPVLKSANVRRVKITVKVHEFPEGHLVASLSSLLPRFPHLRSLRIKFIPSGKEGWQECLCSRLDTWVDPLKISLGHLEEVKISGFMGADDDIDLVRLLFASSNSMTSMTLKFKCNITNTPSPVSLKQMMTEEDDSGTTETLDQKLMNIPSTSRGHWHFGKDTYRWTI